METKTIRFEKGEKYRSKHINYLLEELQIHDRFSPIESIRGGFVLKCLNSFEVTITITEDGE